MLLPFFNRYPHTNFEQLNIDWLLEKVGGFDERIRSNTERITVVEGRCDILEERVDGCETDISDLKRRMTTAEGDIDAVEGRCDSLEDRMTTAEGDIDAVEGRCDSLENRMTTAEGDIDAVERRCDVLEHDVYDISNMITAEYDITENYAIGDYCTCNGFLFKCINPTTGAFNINDWEYVTVMGEIKNFNGNISTLSDEIDAIPIVTPNPGGSGTTLNTIGIGGTVYNINGGGGGGSSVTPNPTGTPTDTLNTVDIEGTIYAIESDVEANPDATGSTDLTKLRVGSDVYNVQNLTVDNAIDSTSDNPISNAAVAGALAKTDFISTDATAASTLRINSQTITGTPVISNDTLDLTPGTWLIWGTAYIFARSNSNATIKLSASLVNNSGTSLSPYINYENEISCYGTNNPGYSRAPICAVVKLDNSSSIKFSTTAKNLYGALSEWSSAVELAAIRIR